MFITKKRIFWVRTKFCTDFDRFLKTCFTNTYLIWTLNWRNYYRSREKLFDWNNCNWFTKKLFDWNNCNWFTKAFGTTDHRILLKEMKYKGFSKNGLAWFKNYLCGWKFKANTNTSYSKLSKVLCGVTQGSILSPLLLRLYMNDFPQAVASNSLLNIDDTCIVFQHKSVTQI